jgi:hypothetical protein
MDSLRLGIVGAGFVAHFHTRAIQQMRGFEIDGIVSPNRAAGLADVVKKNGLGAGVVYPSIREMANHVMVAFCPELCGLRWSRNGGRGQARREPEGGIQKTAGANARLGGGADRVRRLKTPILKTRFMKPIQVQRTQLNRSCSMGPPRWFAPPKSGSPTSLV